MAIEWERARQLPGPVRGMAWMLLAAVASAAMNGIIRELSASLHAFEIAFFRNLFGFLALLPLLLRAGAGAWRTEQLHLHVLRGGLNATAMLAFFLGLSMTPLATVAALSFTSPLFATLLATLILGERLGLGRAIGLAVGFLGALVILRPGITSISLGEILIVASSAFWAAALIDIKILSRTEGSLTITLYAGVFLTPITGLFALFTWTWPTLLEWALLIAVGAIGSLGQMAVVQAFRAADATQVLPGDFTKLIWATLIGYLVFAELPDAWVFVGAAFILAGVAHVTLAGARRGTGASRPDRPRTRP